jgi:hypothetical protein
MSSTDTLSAGQCVEFVLLWCASQSVLDAMHWTMCMCVSLAALSEGCKVVSL